MDAGRFLLFARKSQACVPAAEAPLVVAISLGHPAGHAWDDQAMLECGLSIENAPHTWCKMARDERHWNP
jgi:hypothetical protein